MGQKKLVVRLKMELNIASFNMRGFSSGAGMLKDLASSYMLIALQEHWLRDEELDRISDICPDFNFKSISAMNEKLTEGIFRGRPFSGLALMWHNSLNPFIKFLASDEFNRVLAFKLSLANHSIILFNVYFPCYADGVQYRNTLSMITGFMECVIDKNTDCSEYIVAGDMNFELTTCNSGYRIFKSFADNFNITDCDDLMHRNCSDKRTFINEFYDMVHVLIISLFPCPYYHS